MPRKKKSKKSKSKSVATRKGGRSVAKKGGSFREQMAERAKTAKAVRSSGASRNVISIQNGKFVYKGMIIEPPMVAIVVNQAAENVWYDTDYDKDNPRPPACFALDLDEDNLKSHKNSPNPQGDDCILCELNQWGTADVGKGKACGNRIRLALISADVENLTAEYIEKAEMAILSLSPTAIGGWGTYVNKIRNGFQAEPEGVITSFNIEDSKTVVVNLDSETLDEDPTEDENLLEAISNRRVEAEEMVLQAYDTSGYDTDEPAPKPKKKKKKSKKKTRRGRRG